MKKWNYTGNKIGTKREDNVKLKGKLYVKNRKTKAQGVDINAQGYL
jgi:hypothetical protein